MSDKKKSIQTIVYHYIRLQTLLDHNFQQSYKSFDLPSLPKTFCKNTIMLRILNASFDFPNRQKPYIGDVWRN